MKDGDGDATNEVIRGEEKEVDVDKLVKGYRYGSTLIPVTDADEEQMKLTDGAKCLRIIGKMNHNGNSILAHMRLLLRLGDRSIINLEFKSFIVSNEFIRESGRGENKGRLLCFRAQLL